MRSAPRLAAPADAADPARWRWAGRLAGRLWFLEDELELLPALVPPGATCLDVGANRGVYTVALALVAGPAGRVIAVEPQPGPLRTTVALRRLLRLRTVEIHRGALGDEPGRLSLVVPHRFGMPVYGRSFLGDAPHLGEDDFAEFGAARTRSVAVTTLDVMAAARGLDRLDFVKCDVEGAEWRVLRGGEETLARNRPTLLLEIEERHTRKYGYTGADLLDWLADRGYRVHALAGGTLTPVTAVDPAVRNYVFLPGPH